jgi:hypothetical protein
MGVMLVGCSGSSGSGEVGRVSGVVRAWQVAVARRDVNRACALLDHTGRSMMRTELSGFIAAHATGPSCPALIGFLHDAVMTRSQRANFAAPKPVAVAISADRATARTGAADYRLTRIDGRWRISELPLLSVK